MSRPVSEEYRLVAKEWVEADAAARLLEETKSAVLSRMMSDFGTDMAVSKAEMLVKASREWGEFLERMIEARTKANLLKVKLEWCRMRFQERMSEESTRRHEMNLSR